MTLERPMFPPRAEQCTIIDLSKFKRAEPTKGALQAYREKQEAKREAQVMQLATPERLSRTCRNLRMRLVRREDWNDARRLTNYWRARVDWQHALQVAQRFDVGDAKAFEEASGNHCAPLISLWRVALVTQLLTPAPDIAAVNWKRAQIRAGQYRFTDVKPEALAAALDADIEWLNAHPTRRQPAKRGA